MRRKIDFPRSNDESGIGQEMEKKAILICKFCTVIT